MRSMQWQLGILGTISAFALGHKGTKKKAKHSRYRPEVPRGFQEVKVPRFHDNGTEWYTPAALTPRKYSWYSFLLEAESTPGPQCDRKDFISTKNPLTPTGIEPATFRFVAQNLNHCATAVQTATVKAETSEFHNEVGCPPGSIKDKIGTKECVETPRGDMCCGVAHRASPAMQSLV